MRVAVIGLGYVGLPLSLRLCQIGYNVSAVDINNEKVRALSNGNLPFAQDEPKLKFYYLNALKSKRIEFSSLYKDIVGAKIIFIAVDTPVVDRKPDYKSLLSAVRDLSKYLEKKTIVVIESTLAPKTCEEIIIPVIEKGSGLKVDKDLYLACCPERIRPNYIFKQLTTLPRVIGVSSFKIKPILKMMYSRITSGQLDFVDLTTAETVKTVENAYRDVQIAFANEVALACEELNVNVWSVRGLINKTPWRDMHKPGPGVGGHCIPKDPWLFVSSIKTQNLDVIKSSRFVNDSMPLHVFNLTMEALKQKRVKKPKLILLGYTYIENSDDFRNSPTESLRKILEKEKVSFKIHDPYIASYNRETPMELIEGSDCLILMVSHDQYKNLDLKKISKIMKNRIIVDGKNFFNKETAIGSGFVYKGIGNV